MTLSQSVSIGAALILGIVLILQRRVLISWSMIGAFFVTNLIFVNIGILLLPWTIPYLPVWLPRLKFSLLSQRDYAIGIVLAIGGVLLVLLFYQISHFVFSRGKLVVKAPNLLAVSRNTDHIPLGFNYSRLIKLSAAALFAAFTWLAFHLPFIVRGFVEGMMAGRPNVVIEARYVAASYYPYVLLVFNIIPFFAIALWVLSQQSNDARLKSYGVFYCLSAAFLLLAVFQKRPLILFLVCWLIAHLWSKYSSGFSVRKWYGQRPKRKQNYIQAIFYGAILFAILLVLYYGQTTIGRVGNQSILETIWTLTGVSVIRIFARLASPPPLYVHFFPNVDPFYGLSNLGLLGRLFGYTVYRDTSAIFTYFTGGQTGNAAASTLIDLYGAFGMKGWVIGSALVGIMLHRMDVWIHRMPVSVGTLTLTIFMFLFVYYLSQASVARSLMGYGGAIFVVLWFVLKEGSRVRAPMQGRMMQSPPTIQDGASS